MNRKLETEIKKIIAQSYKNDSDERQTLENVLTHLAQRQENFLQALEDRIKIESTKYDFDSDFDVAVKLMTPEDLESSRTFFPISGGSAEYFLDVDYDHLKDYCGKKYSGIVKKTNGNTEKISYSLQRNYSFILREKILSDISRLYKINRPMIFSPYARKSVDVIFETEIDREDTIDLFLKENTLDGILITGQKLAWNVDVKNQNIHNEFENISADGKILSYEYVLTFDPDEKIFIVPNQHCDDISKIVDDSQKQIKLTYNSKLKEKSYQEIRLNPAENTEEVFFNEFPRENKKIRVRTVGDVESVLACFNATRFGKIFPSEYQSTDEGTRVTMYDAEDRYYISQEDRLLASPNKPRCFIKFRGDDQDKFKIDYVNYVIYYMSRNYPEFEWAGVVE